MTKWLMNRLYLKKKLHQLKMEEGSSIKDHIAQFNKIVLDLKSVEVKIDDEDQAIVLLCSFPVSYENLVDTMMFGRETLTLEEVKAFLSSREVKKMITDSKDNNESKGLFIRERPEK